MTEKENLVDGVVLANLNVPYFLSNAAWYPKTGELKDLATWYAERGLPPALIVPAVRDYALEQTLREGTFMFEAAFSFLEPKPLGIDKETFVEQVNWSQSRDMGGILAKEFDVPEYNIAMGASLANVLQSNQDVSAYVAYQKEAVGAMVIFETEEYLLSMMSGGHVSELEQRLLSEAKERSLTPLIFQMLTNDRYAKDVRSLERWVIH